MRLAPTAARLAGRLPIFFPTYAASLAAALVLVAALVASLWTAGSFDLALAHGTGGRLTVSWVAPNGPADSAGIMPGDPIVSLAAHSPGSALLTVAVGRRSIALAPAMLTPTWLDLLDSGLGLLLLAFGLDVARRGADRVGSTRFWRLCLLAGAALALAPAGRHGVPWALPLEPLALFLFGPAFLELALALPTAGAYPAAWSWRRALLWLPALAALLGYAVYWQRPALLAPLMPALDGLVLGAYVIAGCIRIAVLLRRPLAAGERTRLRWVALSLVGSFLPFALFSALPSALLGYDLLPGQVSALAIPCLFVGIGLAIARTEHLGITDLVRRRPLHIALGAALAVVSALLAGLLAQAGPARWGWPLPLTVVVLCGLVALCMAALRQYLTGWAERALLRDVYDSSMVLQALRAELDGAASGTAGDQVLALLCGALDLAGALLFSPDHTWTYAHLRGAAAPMAWQDVAGRARDFFYVPAASSAVERVHGRPILFVPIRAGPHVLAVLCLGPKRSGDDYTPQDRALLDALTPSLALALSHRRLARPDACPNAGDQAALTMREMEILRCLARGLKEREIAQSLFLNIKTVENRSKSLREKLGAHNSKQAVAIAYQRGLLHLHPSGDLPMAAAGAGLSPIPAVRPGPARLA